MKKRILVILGHPNKGSFCAALADSYLNGARSAQHDTEYMKIGDLMFDPSLHQGFIPNQTLEKDLELAQQKILWAEHIVIVFPIWWSSMPGILKGFIDRVLLPGYAYKFKKNSLFWDRLLKGRSAHIIATMDTPPWYYRIFQSMPAIRQMKTGILEFTGIKPVKVSAIGSIKKSSLERRNRWLAEIYEEGKSA